jgi:HPt (histidine-containing phosphotransfer) domain-containing protein
VHEDEAFGCFADAFAQIELHLQRSLVDPLDDTSHILELAEQRAAALDNWMTDLSPGRTVVDVCSADVTVPEHAAAQVRDTDIPAEFRDVFIEESEEMVAELGKLTNDWLENPDNESVLRDIRRHFHTFKGNGRAVGANVLGELGWAAQDLLDRSLEGELAADETVQKLVNELVVALPELVRSYSNAEGPDEERIRALTNACFELAASGDIKLDLKPLEVTEIVATESSSEADAAAKTLAG